MAAFSLSLHRSCPFLSILCTALFLCASLQLSAAQLTDPQGKPAGRVLQGSPAVEEGVTRRHPKPHVIRKSLSKFLANSTEHQSQWMHKRLQAKPDRKWKSYHLDSHNVDADVFSEVCYEWSDSAGSFIFKHWFKNGEDVLYNRQNGVPVGKGGRHAILDQGIAPTTAPKEEWSHPATEGQDFLVLDLLGHKRNGFFVDLAARYWHRGSNSFHLETYYDWNGICIEPDNNFARGLTLNRTCMVICNNPISDRNGEVVHFNYKIGGWNSRGNEDGSKVTVTLTTVLDSANAPAVMDYLSLDVEDHEWAVLSHFDFNRYKFLVMTVERPVSALHTLLVNQGYRWLTQLRGNFGETVYVHQSLPNLADKMNQYRADATHFWRGAPHEYLLHPRWNKATSSCKDILRAVVASFVLVLRLTELLPLLNAVITKPGA
jgi:hypothetical protein